MEEKDIVNMVDAMSRYHRWNVQERTHGEYCQMFLMHTHTFKDLEAYFKSVYEQSQYFRDISYDLNLIPTFRGVSVHISDAVPEGEVLAVLDYNRVYP